MNYKEPKKMLWTTYVARKKITDVTAWMQLSGITTHEQLVAWCDANGIVPPPREDHARQRRAARSTKVEAPAMTVSQSQHTGVADPVIEVEAPVQRKAPRKMKVDEGQD